MSSKFGLDLIVKCTDVKSNGFDLVDSSNKKYFLKIKKPKNSTHDKILLLKRI